MLYLFFSLARFLASILSLCVLCVYVYSAQLLMWLARYCFFLFCFRKNGDPFHFLYTHVFFLSLFWIWTFPSNYNLSFFSSVKFRLGIFPKQYLILGTLQLQLNACDYAQFPHFIELQNDRQNKLTHLAKFLFCFIMSLIFEFSSSFHSNHDSFDRALRSLHDFRIGSTETRRRKVTWSYM